MCLVDNICRVQHAADLCWIRVSVNTLSSTHLSHPSVLPQRATVLLSVLHIIYPPLFTNAEVFYVSCYDCVCWATSPVSMVMVSLVVTLMSYQVFVGPCYPHLDLRGNSNLLPRDVLFAPFPKPLCAQTPSAYPRRFTTFFQVKGPPSTRQPTTL